MVDVDTKLPDLLRDDDDVVVSRKGILILVISTTGNDWQSYIYSFDRCVGKKWSSECDVYIH